ncbi:MAG: type VI secretion system tip protein VgrG [Planctomycetes bacterium]|nr:type VI secretion system tip protein VgrG [Planctomycetota bacterium]
MRISRVGAPASEITIPGAVSEQGHENWIDVYSFSFGSQEAATADEDDDDDDKPSRKKAGKKRGQSEALPGSMGFYKTGLTLSKLAGPDSTAILDWALAGTSRDIQIDCCRDGVDEPYMRIFVKEARVQSFGQSAEPDEITDEIRVLFQTIAFEATGFSKDQTQLAGGYVRAETTAPIADGGGPGEAAVTAVGGKGVGKRTVKTPAQEVVERAAGRMWTDDEDPDFIQEDRVLAIDAINGVEFALGGFVGSEEVSGLFHFRLEVTSEDLAVAANKVIGKPVSFRIEDHEDIDSGSTTQPRHFHGIVAEMYAGQKAIDHRIYTLVVVPWLWMLTKRTDCRIFQQKTVVEIVEAVFSKLGFTDYDKSNLRATYPALEYCVQYRETDFDFMSRLLEEHGIFYFFRFAAGSHKMILADSSVAHSNCDPKDVMQAHGAVDGKHIRNWTKHLSHISGQVRFRDYNHTTPSETLEAQASSVVDLPKIADYELYDYPGRYPNVSDGGQRAKTRIEAEEVSHCVVDGDGNCDAFTAGTKFSVKEHECDEEKGQEFVLTGVVHRAYVMPVSELKARIYYVNDFECIPKAVTFRPARITPRPTVKGPQTAVVVGPSGEEILPDKYGSVKVQFPWDRDGQKDENSSCFVRVAQTIAGKNWGSMWLPRIGQEVVVEFLEGDPDRPLITGSVYNEDNLPPYALPANMTQSGVKTRSTKEGKAENFNELRFEDKKGSEQIYFHAEKDFERVVEHDDILTVGKDAEGSQTITIEKDRTIEIKEGNDTYTLKQGDRTLLIETGNDTHTVKTGNREVSVDTGNDTHTVKTGNREVSVDTGNDTHTVKTGNREVSVDTGNDTLTVKLGNQTTKVSVGKYSADAMGGIELKVGSNSIKIDQSGITVKGLKVTLDGSVQVDIKSAICQLSGSGMLKAAGGIMKLG